jgi:hypothetical protein
MPLTDIMQGIEAYSFASEVNLASGTKAFRRLLRAQDLFRQLSEVTKDPAARETIARRVEEISARPIDKRYENGFDAALSAYLTALSESAEPAVVAKAAAAAAKAENTWWTFGISRDLMARAVATGVSETAAASQWHVIPATLLRRVDWQAAMRGGLQKWLTTEIPVTVRTITGNQILKALRAAEEKAQIPEKTNVIVMEPPTEEGETLVWKPGRRRASRHRYVPSAAGYPRGRQAARV